MGVESAGRLRVVLLDDYLCFKNAGLDRRGKAMSE